MKHLTRFNACRPGKTAGNRTQSVAPKMVPHLASSQFRCRHRFGRAVACSQTRADLIGALNLPKGQPRHRAQQLAGRHPQHERLVRLHAAAEPTRPDEPASLAAADPSAMLEDIPSVEASMYTTNVWRWRGYNISYAVCHYA